jgi:hypothetical protein
VDEGLPIAYPVLEKDVPCYASGGEQVGTVDHVVSAPEEDIFHGIVMQTPAGQRFVGAQDVASLHEHGVDLRIDRRACEALEPPHGGAPAFRVSEPGIKISSWTHLKDKLLLRNTHDRDWTDED